MPNHGTFNVEISLAKGIIFTKIGKANGTILKLWAGNPYPKFSQTPPPRDRSAIIKAKSTGKQGTLGHKSTFSVQREISISYLQSELVELLH